MTLTPDNANKRLLIQFTDDEWSVMRHLSKVYGNVFFKNFLEKFINQRKEQRRASRRNRMITTFESLPPATQQQVLTTMNLTFDDE